MIKSNQRSSLRSLSLHHPALLVGGALLAIHCGGSAMALSEQENDMDPVHTNDRSEGTGGELMNPELDLPQLGSGGAHMGSDEIVAFSKLPITPVDSLSMGGASFADEPCDPEQLDCSRANPECVLARDFSSVGVSREDCFCDLTRPTDPSDCEPREYLSCTLGTIDLDGDGLFEYSAPIHCSCVSISKQPEVLRVEREGMVFWRHSQNTVLGGCGRILPIR